MIDPPSRLPPLSDAATYCNCVGLIVAKVAMLDYREPTTAIEAYDDAHGDDDLPDPLLTAHRLGRIYLQCCGDLVYSIGKFLDQEVPMVISPAVLARSAAEYASRTWYITDPEDTPDDRVLKMARLIEASLKERGFLKPAASPEEKQLLAALQAWSRRQNFSHISSPQISRLITAILPDGGKEEYDWLSSYVHASATTAMLAYLNAESSHPQREADAWSHAFYAGGLSIMAAARVCELRQGDPTEVRHLIELHEHYLGLYNAATVADRPTDGR